jgi:hypothetical protein
MNDLLKETENAEEISTDSYVKRIKKILYFDFYDIL